LIKDRKENAGAIDEAIAKYVSSFSERMAKHVHAQVIQMEKPEDILSLDLSMDGELASHLVISYLIGVLAEEDAIQEFALIPDSVVDTAFSLPFEQAIDFLNTIYPQAEMYMGLTGLELETYVGNITRLAELTAQKKLASTLSTALDEGMGFDGWMDTYVPKDLTTGQTAYFETVYRQNVFSSYAKGTYDQQRLNVENKPYGMYTSIEDSRTTDICDELDGVILPLDDPFWDTWTPPNHFNCRSTVIALSDEDIEEFGITPKDKPDMSEYGDEVLKGLPWDNLEDAIKEREQELKDLI
jgi:SPP1 gp7 family putative phage head morphogenesis protein